jgi:3-methylcrotonyl-CoA carboxylase alpha subunit
VSVEFQPSQSEGDAVTLVHAGSGDRFVARRNGAMVSVARDGLALTSTIGLKVEMPRADAHHGGSGNAIEAPLHGLVSRLHVALGDLVEKGTPVLQMEAMKLVHTLKAPVPGRIGAIRCAVGDTVPAGAILVEIAPAEVEEKP